MRPLTKTRPKPLVRLGGKALLDYALDALAASGVSKAVINVHYLADLLEKHVAGRARPKVAISDERDQLLDTGGGVARALPQLCGAPFFLMNSDSVWLDGDVPTLGRLAAAWRDQDMDALLLLVGRKASLGYQGKGDFMCAEDGRLRRRGAQEADAPIYIGTALLHPRLFDNAPDGPFSLNLLFDRAVASDRLFGLMHDGFWMHVGTPEALAEAEAWLRGAAARDADSLSS